MNIRAYQGADMANLYDICLQTGAAGKDATGLIDADLLGHIFAAPYAASEAELCFMLTRSGSPIGYVLGTKDSKQFESYFNRVWCPPLLTRYPHIKDGEVSFQQSMTGLLHAGYAAPDIASEYPAHLHINILPAGQRMGMGSLMLHTFISKLRSMDVPGVHLEVSKRNSNAIAFYVRFGFTRLKESAGGIIFGMKTR
jgi:ribosomal protein S18 acetylase RimI-like enzyme